MTPLCCRSVLFLLLAGCATVGTSTQDPDPAVDDTTCLDGHGDLNPACGQDRDYDGVKEADDCDDNDPAVGALLYENDLGTDDGTLTSPPPLADDPWYFDGDSVYATSGGQQALLGDEQSWGDVVVYATLTAQGTRVSCGFDCEESCGEIVPDDCYTEWEALGLGILSASISSTGVITYANSGATDICLEAGSLWDAPSSQGVFVGGWNDEDAYRVPAGSSLDVYYGSWTTDNGHTTTYLDEADMWCFQHGTNMANGTAYDALGAYVPDAMLDYATLESDADGDGTEDHVQWVDSQGVQAQHNVWDYQDGHAAVVVGKQATGGSGELTVQLTVQNRGTEPASAQLTDTVPALWSLVDCDLPADTETDNADAGVDLGWTIDLDGCISNCSVIDEAVITCTLVHNLDTDVDMVTLPAATVEYDSGEGEVTGSSMPATAFDYDHNGDGEVTCGETERWRAGVLARAALDDDQDEGYHGYRCALASNAPDGCYEDGHFLQIAEFMDAPEDDIHSECTDECINPTFDQLARVDHGGDIDLSAGDSADLTFWLVGTDMVCTAEDADGHSVTATASDDSFEGGTVGLSTLNMFGDYDHIKVCEAFELPE